MLGADGIAIGAFQCLGDRRGGVMVTIRANPEIAKHSEVRTLGKRRHDSWCGPKGVSSNHKHIHVYPMVSGNSVAFLKFSDVPALLRPLHIKEKESNTEDMAPQRFLHNYGACSSRVPTMARAALVVGAPLKQSHTNPNENMNQ